ncbi:MAG: hypothetical protein IKI64_10640 [Clostridia bacterium]|nr:hypothetical protein [Clostridia bacterium]
MRSDRITVTNKGDGFSEALAQVEKVAAYKELGEKNRLHLRLLTEEMMGMMRALTGDREAVFWLEDNDDSGAFELHLLSKTRMNAALRSSLLEVSSSGRNSAARGVTGKLRDLFERMMEPAAEGGDFELITLMDHSFANAEFGMLPMSGAEQWSLRSYKAAAEDGKTPKEAWDELEKSVVAKLADDVQIGISGSSVEMTIIKKFDR